MKAGILAATAVIATGVSAGRHHAARHAHDAFHFEFGRGHETGATCIPQCTTIWETITGSPTFLPPPPPPPTSTSTSTSCSTPSPAVETTTVVIVPTPYVTVCSAPGTYTIPATTICITETTVLTSPVATTCTPGTYIQSETTVTVTELETITCEYTCQSSATPTSTSVVPPPAQTTSAAPTWSSVATSSAKPTGPAKGLGGGPRWAVTYTPYTTTGECKTSDEVTADIEEISQKGFTTVRVYSTDCSTLEFVGAACETYELTMIIGIFIEASGLGPCQEQVTEILSWAKWELVVGVIIGNEAIFNGYCTAEELVEFISSTSVSLKAAGCTAPVSCAETLNIWQEYGSSMCDSVDFVAVNIQAFFTASVLAEAAGVFVAAQLEIADSICPGKPAYNTECGWPNAGQPNGDAIPSPDNQCTALASIESACPGNVIYFSMFDDLWKAAGDFDVEQSFGAASCW